ncbi:DUF305 domain-containing protein [Actinomadura algeriensis]|uniref:Uncharacterized protein (DUF305 family) n=1 Tax=Actinomadura algeriensis TaxID=1679523 RepID=A0ABR9JYE8_9ACTN|nr:DUF305 domain-containing protein [Actinomadura algeriensis]MBE1535609.1 uncharacterized protein (DUF305 family) [Actinomadura algeriensis]
MNRRDRAGRVFSAVAFMVIGAVAAILLLGAGRSPDPARLPAAAASDIGFSQDMIVHHQQAVTMVQAAGGRLSPPVAQLATGIEINQLKEIGQMQGWLSLWKAPQVPSGPPMTWMTAHHGHDGRTAGSGDAPMPGMASVREIQRLGELNGAEADTWFLKLMIRHHEGGLIMSTAAARQSTLQQVRSLATLMTTAQRREIATMLGLLSALGHKPLPSPTRG